MSKLTKLLLVCFLSGLASTAAAFDGFDLSCLRPYVGFDGGLRTTQYARENGGNLFPKNFPYVNGFVGLQLHECVALELGYGYSRETRYPRLAPGQFVVGTPLAAGVENADFRSTTTYQGFNANLIGKYQIFDCPNIQILGLIGVSYMRAFLKTQVYAVNNGDPLLDDDIIANTRTFAQNKWIPRLGAGLQHMLTDCIGIRGLIVWENTNQFSRLRPRETVDAAGDPIAPSVFAKLRSSVLYSLGIFMSF